MKKEQPQLLVLTTELASLDKKPVRPARGPPGELMGVSGMELRKDFRKSSLTRFSFLPLSELLDSGDKLQGDGRKEYKQFWSQHHCHDTLHSLSDLIGRCSTCTSG